MTMADSGETASQTLGSPEVHARSPVEPVTGVRVPGWRRQLHRWVDEVGKPGSADEVDALRRGMVGCSVICGVFLPQELRYPSHLPRHPCERGNWELGTGNSEGT